MEDKNIRAIDDKRQFTKDFISNKRIIKVENHEKIELIYDNRADSNEISRIKFHYRNDNYRIYPVEPQIFDRVARLFMDKTGDFQTKFHENNSFSEDLEKLASDAPVINLVNDIFSEAIRQRASDIHFEGSKSKFFVRMRKTGGLSLYAEHDISLYKGVIARLKVVSKMDITDTTSAQDGECTVSYDNEEYSMRLSILPAFFGESAVVRILHNQQFVSINELRLPDDKIIELRKVLELKEGVFFVAGPTGSGKTTTIKTILREMDTVKLKIISIEDPIEYKIPGIVQVEVNRKQNIRFSNLLRNVLRQDPDVIFIGEIRDEETAKIAVEAGMTGHLVLSTIHATDFSNIINRLKSFNIPSYIIQSVFAGAITQRLIFNENALTEDEKVKPEMKILFQGDYLRNLIFNKD